MYVSLSICLFYDIRNVPNILIRNLIWLPHSTGVSGTDKLVLTVWMYEKSVTNYPLQKETWTHLVAFPEMKLNNTSQYRNGCEPAVSALRRKVRSASQFLNFQARVFQFQIMYKWKTSMALVLNDEEACSSWLNPTVCSGQSSPWARHKKSTQQNNWRNLQQI